MIAIRRLLALAIMIALYAAPAMADDAQRRLEDALSFGGDMEKLKAVLAERPDLADKPLPGMFKNYPIHEAIGDKTDTLKHLISLKVNLNAKNGEGETALRQAAGYGKFEALKLLLEAGADPNIADADGEYPLHKAAGYGRVEFARELIKHKANVNVTGKNDETPLIRAATNGHADVAAVLLMAGADKDAATKWGITAMKEAESAPVKERQAGYDKIRDMLTGKLRPGDVASGAPSQAAPVAEAKPKAAATAPVAQVKKDEPAQAPATMDAPAPIVDVRESQSEKMLDKRQYTPKPSAPGFTIDRASVPDAHIAVLSGDGNPDSARELMRKLIRKGFLVERIGVAEVRLDVTTVFHGERGVEVARRLADEIGGAEVKPMSWQSKFDIVVITGGKP